MSRIMRKPTPPRREDFRSEKDFHMAWRVYFDDLRFWKTSKLEEDLLDHSIEGTFADVLGIKVEKLNQLMDKAEMPLGDYTALTIILDNDGKEIEMDSLGEFIFGNPTYSKLFGKYLNESLSKKREMVWYNEEKAEIIDWTEDGYVELKFFDGEVQTVPISDVIDQITENKNQLQKKRLPKGISDKLRTGTGMGVHGPDKKRQHKKDRKQNKKIDVEIDETLIGSYHEDEKAKDPPGTQDQGTGIGGPGMPAKKGKSGQPGLVGENFKLSNLTESQITRMKVDLPKSQRNLLEAVQELSIYSLKKIHAKNRGWKTAGAKEDNMSKRELQESIFKHMLENEMTPADIQKRTKDLEQAAKRPSSNVTLNVDGKSVDAELSGIADDPKNNQEKVAVVKNKQGGETLLVDPSNVALDEEDYENKKTEFGVYSKGGSIGVKNTEPVKTFSSKEEAQEYAKRMRRLLSYGERKYYGMGYTVKPIKEGEVATAMKKDSKVKSRVVKKAKAWMKNTNKNAEEAAKEFDLFVSDLSENSQKDLQEEIRRLLKLSGIAEGCRSFLGM